jgi:hypothetical protein
MTESSRTNEKSNQTNGWSGLVINNSMILWLFFGVTLWWWKSEIDFDKL